MGIAIASLRSLEATVDSYYFFIPDVTGIEDLKDYGEWLDVERYGRVWKPFVVPGWRPFYYGNWIRTTAGWTWVAYEPFGWIVSHYGLWFYERDLGWLWIPGKEWSPARVRWFQYNVYVGWAPLPPDDILLPQPWIGTKVPYWNVVKFENFLREIVGYFVRPILPMAPGKPGDLAFRSPGLAKVEWISKQRVPLIMIDQQIIHEDGFHKITLPDEERKKINRQRNQVVTRTLKPRWDRYGPPAPP